MDRIDRINESIDNFLETLSIFLVERPELMALIIFGIEYFS